MSDVERLRELAARRGYRLVKGQGRVVGKRDHGNYGIEAARTGHKVMGFGNRGVTASLAEVEHYLEGGDSEYRNADVKARRHGGRSRER